LHIVSGDHFTIEADLTVYFKNHSKPVNTLCRKYAEFFNNKVGGTYSNHCTFEVYQEIKLGPIKTILSIFLLHDDHANMSFDILR
jgi:hypothetical protein